MFFFPPTNIKPFTNYTGTYCNELIEVTDINPHLNILYVSNSLYVMLHFFLLGFAHEVLLCVLLWSEQDDVTLWGKDTQ